MTTNIILSIETDSLEDSPVDSERLENLSHQADVDTYGDRELLSELAENLPDSAISLYSAHHHPEWEWGDTCPECGSDRLSLMVPNDEIHQATEREPESLRFMKMGEGSGPTYSVMCLNCEEYLYHIPYQVLGI